MVRHITLFTKKGKEKSLQLEQPAYETLMRAMSYSFKVYPETKKNLYFTLVDNKGKVIWKSSAATLYRYYSESIVETVHIYSRRRKRKFLRKYRNKLKIQVQ